MAEETKELLSCEPERLGHGTYLDEEAKEVVLARRTCIEICLTSNLLCVIFLLGEFELSVRPMADAKRCSNSRITTSGITLLGTTPSPSVYVLPLPFIYFLA
jgi:adenosine deaminase